MINHHLSDALLAEFAAGNLGEAGRLVVACHISMCAKCQEDLRTWEAVGGALLGSGEAGDEEPVPESIWARLDAPSMEPVEVDGDPDLPQPLRSLMGPKATWKWSAAWPGIWATKVPVGPAGTRICLFDFRPGVKVPRHGHSGPECTLVLRGSCHDERGRYQAGDVAMIDSSAHTFQIEEKGCLALQWNTGPLLPESPVLALLNKLFQR